MRASGPPARFTNSASTVRFPSLSSAPPMTRRSPCPLRAGPCAPIGMTGSLRGGRLTHVSPPSPDSSSGSPSVRRRLLVVMRHGKAEAFATEDHRRRLTERGAREVYAAGQWLLAQELVPTHVFVSSAVRTQDTWQGLVAATGASCEAVVDDAIYSAGPETTLDILRRTPEGAEIVLYVGHNPTAASLAHLLDDGNP